MAALAAFFVTDAEAHTFRCAPAFILQSGLERQFGERRRGAGVDDSGERIVELWASESGTWTLLYLTPSGMACLIASGDGWDNDPEPPKGEAS